jgi:hypothetical protein
MSGGGEGREKREERRREETAVRGIGSLVIVGGMGLGLERRIEPCEQHIII